MKILQPLAIAHVALATRHILDMPCIDQADLYSVFFEQLEKGNPVHPGRSHSDAAYSAIQKPLYQLHEIAGESSKFSYRLFAALGWYSSPDFVSSHINSARIWLGIMNWFARFGLGFYSFLVFHWLVVLANEEAWLRRRENETLS
ncbi:MAG TPA: hypothetical protein VE860_01950 [Chthoniobacterales bacterium]|nr:hypothetical protein [Chthoniobacterales bacterium]